MQSSDILEYKRKGFDNKLYLELQTKATLKRLEKFSKGRLYLEIGGKMIFDPHASRVLPGFDPENKLIILKKIIKQCDVIFCVNAQDIKNDRKLNSDDLGYIKSTIDLIHKIKKYFNTNILVSINLVDSDNYVFALEYKDFLKGMKIDSFLRYRIEGYPNSQKVFGENGFFKDEYLPVAQNLVVVTGAASNSGKLSTCIGQIYKENLNNLQSGYAKYETFPIWNLPIEHPTNLAYEAATADIGDYNLIDTYNEHAHGIPAVNYNRDIKAFKIIKEFANKVVDNSNYMSRYKSPTDMGINMAGFCITDDEIVSIASFREISRRMQWYKELRDFDAMKKCVYIYNKAIKYIEKNEYDINISL